MATYMHVHVDSEMNHEERLQHKRQLYRQRREREREERLSRQYSVSLCSIPTGALLVPQACHVMLLASV